MAIGPEYIRARKVLLDAIEQLELSCETLARELLADLEHGLE